MAATSHPLNTSPPSATTRSLPNHHVIVKKERGDAHGTKNVYASAIDLDDRVIISDVRETVISVNSHGKDQGDMYSGFRLDLG